MTLISVRFIDEPKNHNFQRNSSTFREMASRATLRNTDPKKVSGELFALTYGGLVSTLLRDYENVDDVNKQVTNLML